MWEFMSLRSYTHFFLKHLAIKFFELCKLLFKEQIDVKGKIEKNLDLFIVHSPSHFTSLSHCVLLSPFSPKVYDLCHLPSANTPIQEYFLFKMLGFDKNWWQYRITQGYTF